MLALHTSGTEERANELLDTEADTNERWAGELRGAPRRMPHVELVILCGLDHDLVMHFEAFRSSMHTRRSLLYE